ncbi:MAG: glycine cleavage system protein [Pedosphaera sp.]|nr:glycine cleavage system protein [Pedosphaera sp.]
MDVPLVMTIIGRDRTGLVETVASLVAEHEGNWLECRMCRLGGEFAGILRIQLPAENQAALAYDLEALQSRGINVTVCCDAGPTPALDKSLTTLEIVGQDRPGIILEITRALASQRVNVEELSSECVSAPMTGEPLFKARARLQLPPDCPVARLRQDLEEIAADLMVDITFANDEIAQLVL